jgi:hypothetical protein
MDLRFCNDLGQNGFSWIVDEPMTRTSHALAAAGKVWLIDPVDWPDAIERARGLGEAAGVVRLLDRHNRDCAVLAERLGVLGSSRRMRFPEAPLVHRREAQEALAGNGALVARLEDARRRRSDGDERLLHRRQAPRRRSPPLEANPAERARFV